MLLLGEPLAFDFIRSTTVVPVREAGTVLRIRFMDGGCPSVRRLHEVFYLCNVDPR